jgi:hypothetical protein
MMNQFRSWKANPRLGDELRYIEENEQEDSRANSEGGHYEKQDWCCLARRNRSRPMRDTNWFSDREFEHRNGAF